MCHGRHATPLQGVDMIKERQLQDGLMPSTGHMHVRGLRPALLPASPPRMDQAQLALAMVLALVPWAMPGMHVF